MIFLRKISMLVAAVLLLLSCTNDMKDVLALPRSKFSPSQVGDSVTMLYSDSAKLKLMIKANRMLLYDKDVKEPFTVLSKGVFVTFFDESEKVSATLRANYGVRYEKSKRMLAKENVVVVNRKGEKMETEKLTWDEKAQKIYTDAFVKITTGQQVIMGTGMDSNQDFTKYEIRKVTGILQLDEHEQ